jgi:hypothetical protein
MIGPYEKLAVSVAIPGPEAKRWSDMRGRDAAEEDIVRLLQSATSKE